MPRLEDKVAIITGGAAGIGLATAALFLREGAKVCLVDLKQSDLDVAEKELGHADRVFSVAADVSNESDVQKFIQATLAHFSRIDVLVNNAGIECKPAAVHEQATEHFDRVMAVNTRGVFLGMKYALPHMLKAKSGSIINMSSVAGLDGFGNMSPYVASKHAVVGLTKSAALEAGPFGVRVNSVHPSPIHTRMMRAIEETMNPGHGKEVQSQFEQIIPMQHYGEPMDVANLVLFLASDDSSFITGCQYRIDGGMGAS